MCHGVARLRRSLAAIVLPLLVCSAAAAEVLPPRPLGAQAAPYPPGAAGDAVVAFVLVIDAEGRVSEAREVPGRAAPSFVDAARAFVRELRFEPALQDGVPVPVEIEYVVRYEEPPAVPEEGAEVEADAPVAEFETEVVGKAPDDPVSAGDFRLDPRTYGVVPRRTAEQLLTLAPGVLLRNHQGAGHASAVFLRGFDAGEGQDIEFRLDGVPLNEVSNPHGHGYADTHFILPELVQEVRVIEGPFDPAQGDFAVAGSAHYRLGLPERGLRVQAGYGSYDAQELLLLWGPENEEDGTFVGVRLQRGDGFGVNRSYGGATAMAGLERRLGERTTLRLVAHSHSIRFDSAGVIRADAYEAGQLPCAGDADSQFFCAADENQGGASSRHGLYAVLERVTGRREMRQVAYFSTRRLRLREDFTGFLLDEQGRGDGTEQLYDAVTFGLHGSLALHPFWLGRRQTLTVGYDARHDDGEATVRRLLRSGGAPYARLLDNELRITQLGTFGSVQVRPTEWLSVQGGVRVDSFSFDVTDRNRPTETRAGPREPVETYDAGGLAVQPRVSSRVTLVRGLDWLAAYGLGVRSSDAAALSGGEFAPFARVRAAETGLAWQGDAPFSHGLRLVGFVTHVDRDLVFDERQARNVFLGASTRHGALAVGTAAPHRSVDLQGSVTWAEAHLSPEGTGFFALGEGPRLPYVPRWSGRVDAVLHGMLPAWLGGLPARGGLGATWVGARPLPNERVGAPYATVDAGAQVRFGMVEMGLAAENLLDTRYHQAEFAYASNFTSPDAAPSRLPALHFAAGAPRMLLATVALLLDGEPSSERESP